MTQGNVPAEQREELETTGDFLKDEKHKTVSLTESGIAKAERLLQSRLQPGGLYDPANMPLLHHINQALRAHALFRRDVDYMVKDGQVVIVDEFTGRLMPGRRWSDGLHQAVEAKEKVKIERENQTLATITFQNYFRKYDKLSGMTGTAETEAPEFAKIYELDVVVVPTNRELVRIEEADAIYRTETEKYQAIVEDVVHKQEAGPARPVWNGLDRQVRAACLVCSSAAEYATWCSTPNTTSARPRSSPRRVVRGNVTIATNMAGRGTDILLGGNPEYMARQQALKEEGGRGSPQGGVPLRRRRDLGLSSRTRIATTGSPAT